MSILVHIVLYCVIISVYLFFTMALNPRYRLHRMPKAITDKVPLRTKNETRAITIEDRSKTDYKDKRYHVRAGFRALAVSACGSVIAGSLIFAAKLIVSAM